MPDVTVLRAKDDPGALLEALTCGVIAWQTGVVPSEGRNGMQVEEVLQVCADRISDLNLDMPCDENEQAINCILDAISALNTRTQRRREQGVEGTNQPHVSAGPREPSPADPVTDPAVVSPAEEPPGDPLVESDPDFPPQ